MKIYQIWTLDLSHQVQDRSKKNSFRRSGPWVISYRSSHKSSQSGNPWRVVAGPTDRQTDGRSADNSVL
jgi:hypothetical protein